MTLEDVLELGIASNASDINLTSDCPIALRVKQSLEVLKDDKWIVYPQFMTNIITDLTSRATVLMDLYAPEEQDGTYVYEAMDGKTYYFRFNIGLTAKKPHITIRKLINSVPTVEAIRLNEGEGAKFFEECMKMKEGLYLVIGATGSGKSTTLTCVLDAMLKSGGKKVITLEEPIEYYYKTLDYEKYNSIIIQRQVGFDTKSFDLGLRAAMRQNPDIILVGEIRDPQTAASALQAANTGHVVLATLHAASLEKAVERISFLVGSITNDFTFVRAIMSQKLEKHGDTIVPIRRCKNSMELFGTEIS